MRVSKQRYSDAQMTDQNSLSSALLQHPAKISRALTFLGGREDKRFPLTMLTEGVGNTESIDKYEYEYNVMDRIDRTRPVAETPNNTSNVGQGNSRFTLKFPDKWFIKDYVIIGPSGVQCRIMEEPRPVGSDYEYTLQIANSNASEAVPASDLQAGAQWGQLFAPVGTDFSRGNAHNFSTPAKIRHKITKVRKSYQMSGSAKDYVMDIEFPTENGTTNRWMPFEMWQFMLKWKMEMEMLYWYGEQSYDENGNTRVRDENDQPVNIGPGLFQQIVNKDTYSRLTEDKLRNVIGDLFYGMTDAQDRQVTLYTGTGGMREFDRAMKDYVGSTNFQILDQNKFITGSGRDLTLTGYFTTYQHVDGHTVNVVKQPLFDHGPVADTRPKHPETGYSLESYRMCFVDQSNYEGEPNLKMINKQGEEMKEWVVPGSTIPDGYAQNTPLRATDIDGASVHYLKTSGVLLRRFDTSLDLQCIAS